MEILSPHFDQNSIIVVYATDENYAQALTVAVASLIEHASEGFNYEIYVLSDNLCFEYSNELEKMRGQHKNIFIKVLDVNALLQNIDRAIFFESNHIKMSAYYRLFIQEIFKNFSKTLYLDVDTIILANVAELFNTDLGDYKLGAVPDSGLVHARVNNIGDIYKYYSTAYYNNFAQEMDDNYFNSGVILFNLAKIDESFIARGIQKLQDGIRPELHDQDILNYIAKGSVKLLDKTWNSQILGFLEPKAGFDCNNLLLMNQAKYTTDAKIIHFVSHLKPWFYPEIQGGKIFWHYARKSAYYEVMLFENIIKRNKLLQKESIFTILLIKIELMVCRLFSIIFIGKSADKYKIKKAILKKRLRENRCKA